MSVVRFFGTEGCLLQGRASLIFFLDFKLLGAVGLGTVLPLRWIRNITAWQEFIEFCDFMLGDATENVGEPGLGVDAV
jgi:hypothetical protein